MKRSTLLIIPALLLAFACKKKEENPQNEQNKTYTPTEAKQSLSDMSSNLKTDIVTATKSEGGKAMASLSKELDKSSSDPFESMARLGEQEAIKELYLDRIQDFREIFLPRDIQNGRISESDNFDFEGNKGEWEYNPSTKDFDKTKSSSYVVLKFPADTTNLKNNNATLTITSYTEMLNINDEGDTAYLPTRMTGNLYIGSTKYADVDFTASYSDGTPVNMDYSVYLKPFTQKLKYTDGGAKLAISASVLNENSTTPISENSFEVVFKSSTKEDVSKVTGYASYRDTKITGTIDVAAMEAIDEPKAADANKNITIALQRYSNSSPVGTLEFFDDSTGDVDVRIKFTDGSTENAETYFKPVVDELESYSNTL